MQKILLSLLLIFTSIYCNSFENSQLSQEQFIKFYLAVQNSDETISKENNDSLRFLLNKHKIQNILTSQNISQDDVLKTVHYYNEYPSLWKPFFDSVHTRILKDEK